MANYQQWRTFADTGEVRRVTWVCGDQRVLVEEIIDTTRNLLDVSDLNYVSLTAGATPDRVIWAQANQYSLTPGANRLVLVRDAERITNWAPLAEWLANTRKLAGVYLLFVSGEADLPYVYADGKRAGLRGHVELMKAPRGHVVRCATPNGPDAIAWVRRRAHTLDEEMARHLLTRTGGNLAVAASVCAKISLFDMQPGSGIVNQLCDEIPADSFVESLLTLKKREALLAVDSVPHTDFGKVISLLDTRLDLLAALWRAVRSGYTTREVQGLPMFLVRQFMPIAKHYDPDRCAYSRRVLAVVDEAQRGGARRAVLEALVALW